jgi:hypothetical protein
MPGKRYVFVLRLWTEDEQLAPIPERDWRGSLHRVNDDQTYYFASIDKLGDILQGLMSQQEKKTNTDL